MTKKNCKKMKDIILISKILEFLKFLIEKKMINREVQSPNIKE